MIAQQIGAHDAHISAVLSQFFVLLPGLIRLLSAERRSEGAESKHHDQGFQAHPAAEPLQSLLQDHAAGRDHDDSVFAVHSGLPHIDTGRRSGRYGNEMELHAMDALAGPNGSDCDGELETGVAGSAYLRCAVYR
ncbi:hypothetical protein ASE10_05575 [Lysobacter sp. Root76]|nr:hypothetical protein ASE10_05575 [Lysobacter sp. Root76]KRD66678.1 hypothetical protein ASE45_15225 [Lysobacter sp. Root96]